jgi:hypothetical protein
MPVVPATQEVKVGESWSKPGLGKKKKEKQQQKPKAKGLRCESSRRALA